MRRLLFIVVAAAALWCRAQEPGSGPARAPLNSYMDAGMEVGDVRVPYYDDEGKLQAQLHGGSVKMLEGAIADITNLRIDVYEDDAVVMTIFAPHCFSKILEEAALPGKKVLSVYSDGDVLIEMDLVSISGRGFRFSTNGNRFEILNDSRVLVKEAARTAKGMKR